jgi:hypothetical protein
MVTVVRKERKAPEVLKNRIKLVGIELEGGWSEALKTEYIVRDGSLNFDELVLKYQKELAAMPDNAPPEERKKLKLMVPKYIGEVVSKPMATSEIGPWLQTVWPKFVNKTCGLHVHMSFHYKLNYQRLMTPDYTTAIVAGLLEWAKKEDLPRKHPIWERLEKKDHKHCAHVYLGDAQVKQKTKDWNSRGKEHSRYTAINYCAGQHGTVECRLLPMFDDPEQGLRAINEVLVITNRFLRDTAKKEKRLEATVVRKTPLSFQIGASSGPERPFGDAPIVARPSDTAAR